MENFAFYIDTTRCLGCRACQTACKDKNNLPENILFRKVRTYETKASVGKYPAPGVYHYSSACNHCGAPMCVRSCPTGAMYKAVDGTVQHEPDLCLKCRYCVGACPYKVPRYIEAAHRIVKCDACKDLRSRGELPVCVDTCVMGCIEWGMLAELKQRHKDDLPVNEISPLPAADLTRPSILIKAKACAFDKDFMQMEPRDE